MTSRLTPTSGSAAAAASWLLAGIVAAGGVALLMRGLVKPVGCAPLLTRPDLGQALLLTLLAPVLEELLVRDALQRPLMTGRWGGPWGRCLLTALVFSALHLPRGAGIATLVFWPAVVNGWLYERTRRWQACALAHAAANGFALLLCSAA